MTKKAKSVSLEKEIEKVTAELLKLLQVEATISVSRENDDHYQVKIETSESGLLIGRHGETINSLQLLLGVILYKKLGQWIRVVVDIGEYRKTRENQLKEMVDRIVTEVCENGKIVTLPYLTPWERRSVHMMLTGHEKVVTESVGEGKVRRLTIKPR